MKSNKLIKLTNEVGEIVVWLAIHSKTGKKLFYSVSGSKKRHLVNSTINIVRINIVQVNNAIKIIEGAIIA